MGDITFRTYSPGDENDIVKLFERCFGHSLSIDHWKWKYTQNPYGNYHIMVAVMDGRIVAHYGGYPVYMHDGPSRKVKALHIGDIMTDPQVRGLGMGRRSVIARVTRAFYERFCEGNVAFNFGAPADRHLRLGRMLLSYQSPGPVSLWTAPANRTRSSTWSKMLGKFGRKRYAIEETSIVDAEVGELYERIKGNLGISLCREVDYLRWRYLICPGKAYRFFRITHENRLALWVVVARKKDEILLGDILVGPTETFLFPFFVKEISSQWGGLPMRLWASDSVRWWTEMLTKAGFTSALHPWRIHQCLTVFDEDHYSSARMSREWFYSMGDFDLF